MGSSTPANQRIHGVRVTGVLTTDAQLLRTAGNPPHAYLDLTIQPEVGLPYHARIDIGTDAIEHMRAEGLMPALRKSALVSLGAQGMAAPRTDHGHAVHQLLCAFGLVLLQPPPQQRAKGAGVPHAV